MDQRKRDMSIYTLLIKKFTYVVLETFSRTSPELQKLFSSNKASSELCWARAFYDLYIDLSKIMVDLKHSPGWWNLLKVFTTFSSLHRLIEVCNRFR